MRRDVLPRLPHVRVNSRKMQIMGLAEANPTEPVRVNSDTPGRGASPAAAGQWTLFIKQCEASGHPGGQPWLRRFDWVLRLSVLGPFDLARVEVINGGNNPHLLGQVAKLCLRLNLS